MTAPARPPSGPPVGSPVGSSLRSEVALADLIARLRRAMRRAARAADPSSPLTVAQLELLSCVAENPRPRPGQIARRLRIAPNSVTTLVNALCSRDLLVRSGGREDRRSVTLSLTPAGRQAVTGWHATNAAILRSAMAELPPAQRDLLSAALPALHDLIQAIDTQADPAPNPAGTSP